MLPKLVYLSFCLFHVMCFCLSGFQNVESRLRARMRELAAFKESDSARFLRSQCTHFVVQSISHSRLRLLIRGVGPNSAEVLTMAFVA